LSLLRLCRKVLALGQAALGGVILTYNNNTLLWPIIRPDAPHFLRAELKGGVTH
jgi:hypothetical protein